MAEDGNEMIDAFSRRFASQHNDNEMAAITLVFFRVR